MKERRISTGIATQFLFAFAIAAAGCGSKSDKPILREAFEFTHAWKLKDDLQGCALSAELTPQPLVADRPAMLKVRVRSGDAANPFKGRIWYRFAFRRGERFSNEASATSAPTARPEEGVPPRYDDWFEWAEIIEPRTEVGETVFSTPVMLSKGKAYVQFRIAAAHDSQPQELLDWFVYVENAK